MVSWTPWFAAFKDSDPMLSAFKDSDPMLSAFKDSDPLAPDPLIPTPWFPDPMIPEPGAAAQAPAVGAERAKEGLHDSERWRRRGRWHRRIVRLSAGGAVTKHVRRSAIRRDTVGGHQRG